MNEKILPLTASVQISKDSFVSVVSDPRTGRILSTPSSANELCQFLVKLDDKFFGNDGQAE